MFIVAVTGGLATGKSTVAKVFKRQGIPIIDARKIAKEIVKPGKPCYQKIHALLGDGVLKPTQELDQNVVRHLVSENPEIRLKLNEITHPVIQRIIFQRLWKYFLRGHAYVVMDLPLLFETDVLTDYIHKIITVTCEPDQQVQRLMIRNVLSEGEAKKRLESQMPLEIKCKMSHFVIDNSHSIAETEAEAMRIYHLMQKSKKHLFNRIAIVAGLLLMLYAVFSLLRVYL